MKNLSMLSRHPDWISLVLAILLFIAPWVLGFAGPAAAAWNAWICGAIVALLALAALTAFAVWEEWVGLLLGVWVFIAPWALGFSADMRAMWAHVVLGALIAIASAWELQQPHSHVHA